MTQKFRIHANWMAIIAVTLIAAMALPASVASGQAKKRELKFAKRPDLITPQTEGSINKALAFLARTQSRDGSWRTQSGYGNYPCAMTALAGLALLADGNTPVEGKYAVNVRRAVDYILQQAQRNANGLIAVTAEEQQPMYGHGFSMLFLGEVYGMERDTARQKRIEDVLKKAIKLVARSQSAAGGWLYTPDSGGDEGSVTVTQIQGMRSCRNAGLKVPKKVIEGAIKYIEKSTNPDGGIRYRASMGGASRPPISAAAVAVLYNAGQYEHPVADKCLKYIKNLLKGRSGVSAFRGHNFYATLYCAQAMWLSSEENWKGYFPAVRDHLIKTQSGDGSWMGDGVGTTYGTAIALITLQLPYNHLPILSR